MLQFLVFFQFWKINIHPTAFMIITQIRKLALFEFIDTKFLILWIKSIFCMELKDKTEAMKVTKTYCDFEATQDCTVEDFLDNN